MPRLYPTLSRYVARHFLVTLAATLAVVAGIIALLDFIELMRRAAGRADALTLLGMALLKLPNMIDKVLPFAVLIGGMVALWRLARHHELVVMRAVGVSIWQILAPAVLLVGVIGTLHVAAVNPLASALYRSYAQLEDTLILRRPASFALSEAGLWLREPRPEGGWAVIHAEQVRQDGTTLLLRDISVILVDGRERLTDRVEATHGVLREDGLFTVHDVWWMVPGRPGEHRDRITRQTTLTLARVQERFSSPETLSVWDLPQFIATFEAAGFSALRHRLHLQALIASPVLLCAMVLVAAVVSVRPNQRSGGALGRVVGGLAAGFLLYFFTRLTLALGLSSALPVWLAAWSPTLVTLMVGSALLLHLEDG